MKIDKSFLFVFFISILMFCTRLIPHEANFSPVIALFLISGFLGQGRWYSFFLPLVALSISDVYLGSYPGWAFTYIPMILIVLYGHFMKKQALSFLTFGLTSALTFFLVSNLGVWLYSGLYSLDLSGLLQCYQLAVPFFRASLVSTLSVLTFFYLLTQAYTKLVTSEALKSN